MLSLVFFSGAVALIWPQHGLLLNWDEVDYVNAARAGVVGNLFEIHSLSPQDYLRFAREKLDNTPVRLPAGYDEHQDPLILRHDHPPGVAVAMALLSPLKGERGLRAVQLLACAALFALAVVAYVISSPKPTHHGLALLLVGLTWASWHLYGYLQYHGPETVCIFAVGICLVQWVREPRARPWGIALCGALALAVLVLQSGAFLLVPVAASVIAVAWSRGSRSPRAWLRQYLLPGVGLIVAIVVVLWPGGVLKASIVKIPLLYAYLIFRGQEYASNQSAVGSGTIVIPAVIALAAIVYLSVTRRGEISRWGPWAMVGGFYTLALLPFSVDPRYALPGIAALFVLVAYAIDSVPVASRVVAAGLLVVLVAAGFVNEFHANTSAAHVDKLWRADLAFLQTRISTAPALMDGGHIYRYYLKKRDIEDLSPAYDGVSLLVRRRGEYEKVTDADFGGKFVTVLRRRTAFATGAASADLSRQCPVTVLPTVWLWDCRALPGAPPSP